MDEVTEKENNHTKHSPETGSHRLECPWQLHGTLDTTQSPRPEPVVLLE